MRSHEKFELPTSSSQKSRQDFNSYFLHFGTFSDLRPGLGPEVSGVQDEARPLEPAEEEPVGRAAATAGQETAQRQQQQEGRLRTEAAAAGDKRGKQLQREAVAEDERN